MFLLGRAAPAQTPTSPQSNVGHGSSDVGQISGDHCASPNLPIPDAPPGAVGPFVTSELVIAGTGEVVQDLGAGLQIAHTWVGDLEIHLTPVAGPSVSVFDQLDSPHGCS
jgi:hypothetical protein